jgi:short-subunit dehydrogenase
MKKAIVVGASSGIGNELAKILVKNSFQVGVTGRRKEMLEKLKQDNPDQIIVSSFDCISANNAQMLSELRDKLGGLDLLILSAGMGDLNEELKFNIENETNLLNVNAFTEIVGWTYNQFEKQGTGHLVAISSIAGIRGSRVAPAYNASKAYQINYLEGLRQKARRAQMPISVTDIRPGFVDTDMAKGKGLFWVASKEKAVKQIFAKIKRKKGVGYVTKRWWFAGKLLRVLPNSIYERM